MNTRWRERWLLPCCSVAAIIFWSLLLFSGIEIAIFQVQPVLLKKISNELTRSSSPYTGPISSGILDDSVPMNQRIEFFIRAHAAGITSKDTVQDPLDLISQRRRFDQGVHSVELEYCLRSVAPQSLLTLFTTLSLSGNATKQLAQQTVLESFAYLRRKFGINSVVFTTSVAWTNFASFLGIDTVRDFASNRYGTPYLRDMYRQSMERHDSFFYSYANADILFTQDLVTSLCSLRSSMESKKRGGLANRRVLIVGRRMNYPLQMSDKINTTTSDEYEKFADRLQQKSELFSRVAQDYFVVTKETFDWSDMPQYVIGRLAFDNCLLSQAVLDKDIDTIDATQTIRAIHLTGSDGNYASHQADQYPDYKWNEHRCLYGTKQGSTDKCEFFTEWGEVGKIKTERHPSKRKMQQQQRSFRDEKSTATNQLDEHENVRENSIESRLEGQNLIPQSKMKMLEIVLQERFHFDANMNEWQATRKRTQMEKEKNKSLGVANLGVGMVVLVLSGSGLLYIFMSLVLPRFKAWEQQHGALSLMDVHIAVHHVFRLVWNAVFISSKKTRERREV